MIYLFFRQYPNVMTACGILFTFAMTLLFTGLCKDRLPADEGRDFAVDGKLSKGKPRGAGIIFILCFVAGVMLFSPIVNLGGSHLKETCIYLVLVCVEMLTGFLDDKSDKPWGRVKKGLLDLAVSLVLAWTYIYCNGAHLMIMNERYDISVVVMFVLIVAFCWMAINVTNCADGVDGLSGTLVIVTLVSFLATISENAYFRNMDVKNIYTSVILIFISSLVAYLWYNAGPSILMMGDAGSRAMGIFICIIAMKSGHLLMLLPFALVLILDGGLGLFKVSVIKITKKKSFMKKLRTPLHDHVRKNLTTNWSNNQCVTRFAIIQVVINIAILYFVCR